MANKPLSVELQRPLDGEIWKDIAGLEGSYQVSGLGRVKRIARLGADGRRLPERIMRTSFTSRGYVAVTLTISGGRDQRFLVHRLVMIAFNGPPPAPYPEYECCHQDGTKTNNILTNLYWGTDKQNSQDMVRHGRSCKGIKNPLAVLDDATVKRIADLRRAGDLIEEITAKTGAARSTISHIINGHTWTHVTGGPIDRPKRRIRNDHSVCPDDNTKAATHQNPL